MPNILIIGGTHGDEPTGIALAHKCINHKTEGISAFIANPKAVNKNIRFLETDLNRSFNLKYPISFEEILTQEIKLKLDNFDLILDFHDTDDIGTTCAIITTQPNELHLKIIEYLGLDKVVIMPASGSLISQNPEKSISIEISKDQQERFNADYFYDQILHLKTRLNNLDRTSESGVSIYKYITSIHFKTFNKFKKNFGNITNFKALTENQLKLLNLHSYEQVFYPIFYGCSAYKDNAFSLVSPI